MGMNADRLVDKYLAGGEVDYEPDQKHLPRGIRNANPGNIRGVHGFIGELGVDDEGYSIFDTANNGIRACAKDLLTKYNRGLVTVRSILSVYAPKNENDTEAYIAAVCQRMGVTDYAWLHLTELPTLTSMVTAMIHHENGGDFYPEPQIEAACRAAL